MRRPDLAPDMAADIRDAVCGPRSQDRRLRRVYRLTAMILTFVALATVVQVTLAVAG